MKIWTLGLLGAFVILILEMSPVAQAGGDPGQPVEPRYVSFEGVSFIYDGLLARDVIATSVSERRAAPDEASWTAYPQHTLFEFINFRGSSATSLNPAIYIFPVRSSYTSLTPGETTDLWLPGISALRSILASRPDLRSAIEQSMPSNGSPPDLPYLPPINAARIPVGKPAYIKFGNGIGIRYLAEITQDASPPNRDNASYTFQGLTTDGKYYIAAQFPAFPVAMQPLPPMLTNDTKAYFGHLLDEFDRIDNSRFTPDLNKLDAIVKSLTVNRSEASRLPGLPRTGNAAPAEMMAIAAWLGVAMLLTGGLAPRLRAIHKK